MLAMSACRHILHPTLAILPTITDDIHMMSACRHVCTTAPLSFSWKYEFNNYVIVVMSACRHVYTHIPTLPTLCFFLFETISRLAYLYVLVPSQIYTTIPFRIIIYFLQSACRHALSPRYLYKNIDILAWLYVLISPQIYSSYVYEL